MKARKLAFCCNMPFTFSCVNPCLEISWKIVKFVVFSQTTAMVLNPRGKETIKDDDYWSSLSHNRCNFLKWILKEGGKMANWDPGFLRPFLSTPSDRAWKGGWQGGGVIQTPGSSNKWHFIFSSGLGQSVSECYPHALHSRHGPEGPQGPQGSHRPEGLDPSSPKQGGSEVDERDLWLLVGYC